MKYVSVGLMKDVSKHRAKVRIGEKRRKENEWVLPGVLFRRPRTHRMRTMRHEVFLNMSHAPLEVFQRTSLLFSYESERVPQYRALQPQTLTHPRRAYDIQGVFLNR